MAWVTARPDSEFAASQDAEVVKAFCKGRIAHFKVPHYVKFVDDFPMTITGKVRKVEMREVSIGELGLGAAATIDTA